MHERALDRLRQLAISDTGFVFDPFSGSTFTVNQTGLTILEGLRRGEDRPALVDRLRARFDVHGEDLERDLDEFIHLLRQGGLLGEEGSP